jgi:hypothetical protein
MPRRRSWSDDDLEAAVSLSENLNQVCDLLGIAPGRRTYEHLRRHIRRLGIDGSHFPPAEPQPRRGRWSDNDLRAVVATSRSVAQVLTRLGYKQSGGMHRLIRQKIANLELDTSHFGGQAWAKGRRSTVDRRRPLVEILVANSTYTNNGRLRMRLIAEGLKPPWCERCSLDTWLGEPLPLHLDHVNGDHTDNRLENLRILCPNCHALTPTWCGRKRQEPA